MRSRKPTNPSRPMTETSWTARDRRSNQDSVAAAFVMKAPPLFGAAPERHVVIGYSRLHLPVRRLSCNCRQQPHPRENTPPSAEGKSCGLPLKSLWNRIIGQTGPQSAAKPAGAEKWGRVRSPGIGRRSPPPDYLPIPVQLRTRGASVRRPWGRPKSRRFCTRTGGSLCQSACRDRIGPDVAAVMVSGE